MQKGLELDVGPNSRRLFARWEQSRTRGQRLSKLRLRLGLPLLLLLLLLSFRL